MRPLGSGLESERIYERECCAFGDFHGLMRGQAGGIIKWPSGGRCGDVDRRGGQPSLAGIMKALKSPQSGKRGPVVSFKNRYGQAEREHVVPINPRTPAQVRARSDFGRASARWRTLTDAQRRAWMATAKDAPSRSRLGQSGPLTGCALFVKINSNLAAIGLPQVDMPPDFPQFGPNPVGELSITNTGGVIELKLSVAGMPRQPIIVSGAAPCSAGVSYVDHFANLGLLPAPNGGFSTITDLYVAKYGVPPVGTRVVIRIRQQVNGWDDYPMETTTVVPAA